MLRVGILTSGGDCQGLNSAIRGVAKALYVRFDSHVEIYGIADGYRGLIEGNARLMNPEDFSGILTLGGTILGTSRQPFKMMRVVEDDSVDKVKNMKENYKKLKLDCLVILGGNGTHKTANLLSQEGLNIVTLPKTIDNDIWGTEMTFGFYSAMNIATNVVDCIHTTATSHGRVFIVEIMGHKVGWLTLYAGVAGGADVILIPEIPYDIDEIADTIQRRNKNGKRFSILAVAEGAISKEEAALSKKQLKAARTLETQYPSISYRIAERLGQKTGQEIRVTVPGHFQRGGSPCPYDRVLSTRFGTAAANLIAEKKFGNMVALQNGAIIPVPLSEVAGKLKRVPLDSEVIRTAREIGISFGDHP
ncbi:6-phosphofructokinase [Caproicibacterium sp. BJN0003]|uniref:6-phosphofructokinase n=1 Tax=Caproicibacterium sp. BJN0003 TaxID=2994078 RepID=UPI0022575B76|nr:ATP-dependent 6-phosphofructokinase [Caproicibacterium sp. BJN0003]UZT81128.1 ATP-dependent 6-phosphofructokinase [Caproicibacterium sp. BJN0003]